MELFAEGATATDFTSWLAGSSGWGGAGLLGAVLAWLLLKHLPAKDSQLSVMIDKHTAAMQGQSSAFNTILAEKRVEFTKLLAEQRNDFKEALKTVTDHCERESNHLAESMKGDLQTLSDIVKDLAVAVDHLNAKP